MGKTKYAIGVDFGTESGRAVLVDVADGREVATAVHKYANGVIDERLPGTDIRLQPDGRGWPGHRFHRLHHAAYQSGWHAAVLLA